MGPPALRTRVFRDRLGDLSSRKKPDWGRPGLVYLLLPQVRFTSEVFHPNVYTDGTLCMDIIQDQWSPCHNVSTILTSIQARLSAREMSRAR